ncbi:sulfur carrier protein ThiS [Hominibacterium faecale]|uniref:sulfur carrier protein ThiS n=1 Tax=Hominibacterium faecale TaxID=2839743 RepID=UPI0022B2A3ED|nr:sulfur carrier protein ThiS [Hominibacterium faecale]
MKVNGEEKKLEQNMILEQFLEGQGYDPKRVAVELNGEILPKSDFKFRELSDADTLEIVHFVGGG